MSSSYHKQCSLFVLNIHFVFIGCIRIARIRNDRFIGMTNNLKNRTDIQVRHVALIVSYQVWKNTYIFVAIMSFSSNWHTLKVTISEFTMIEI